VSSKAFVVIYILLINCSVSLLTTCAYMLRLFVILLFLWTDSWCIKCKDVLFSKVDPLLVRWSLDDLSSDKTCLIPIGTLPSIILQYSNINSSCMSSLKLPCSFLLKVISFIVVLRGRLPSSQSIIFVVFPTLSIHLGSHCICYSALKGIAVGHSCFGVPHSHLSQGSRDDG
jgi:hypothetical protein